MDTQWDFEYPLISKFNRKYNVTCQILLMTIIERAIRKYHKGNIDELVLGVYTPVNTRQINMHLIFIKKENFLMLLDL